MDIVHHCCAGIDVHKRTIVICVLTQETTKATPQRELRTFSTLTEEVLRARDWLQQMHVTHIALESTGVYTLPPMLQIGGGTSRSGRRRSWADAEDHADLLLINLHPFD